MSETDKLEQIRRQMESNDPPIEIGQIWVARTDEKIIRRVRVLAPYPKEGMKVGTKLDGKLWLFEELPGGIFKKMEIGRLGIFSEFNLRYVCELERETNEAV